MNCHVNDIETKYIEGEPEIATVGVYPETTNPPKRPPQNKHLIPGFSIIVTITFRQQCPK